MRILRQALTLLSGEAAARILGVLIFALLARVLGLEDFGTLSFAMSTALMLSVLVDIGQNSHLGRLVARAPADASGSLSKVLTNKAIVGGIVIVVLVLALGGLGFSAREVTIAALMGVWGVLLTMLDSMRAVVRALGMMRLDSTVNALESAGRLAGVVIAWALGVGLEWYAAAFIAEALLACLAFAVVLGIRTDIGLRLSSPRTARRLLSKSWALGVMALAMAGFYRVDQVIVQGIAGAAENGLYGAATRVAFTATVGGGLVMMAGYPELSRVVSSGGAYRETLKQVLRVALLVGGLSGAVIGIGAAPIVHALYGSRFEDAIVLVRVLSLVVLGNSVTLVGMYSASALGREQRAVRLALGMILVNLIANLLVVPRFGATGAAWVSAVGELVMAAGMLYLSRDFLMPVGITREVSPVC